MDDFLASIAELETDLHQPTAQILTFGDFNKAAPKYDTSKPMGYWEPCQKCGGTGFWRGVRKCFACNGQKGKSFKTSPEAREKSRDAAAVRKVKTEAENVETFNTAHPEVAAWIMANPGFEFAVSLGQAVRKYGELTERQLAAAQGCIDRTKIKIAAAAERRDNAVVCDVSKIEAAFNAAREHGIKSPKLNLGQFQFSRAPDHGRNPGAIYVTQGDDYLGKVQSGKFFASAVCGARHDDVVTVAGAPYEAAVAYGRRTGECCVCGRELTNHASINRGIGPICAERFGW